MRILTTSVALAATFAIASHAVAAEAVSVTGNVRVDGEIVRQSFGKPASGERFTDGEIDAGVKQLFASGFFADVKAAREGAGLHVSVVENPSVGNVVFNGNQRLRDDVLQATVATAAGKPLVASQVDADVAAIVGTYARIGRVGAHVEKRVVARDRNVDDVLFTITEGEKASIGSIEFRGATVFSQNRLKGVISTKETSLLSKVKDDDVYDIDRAEADARSVERLYHDNGYVDAIVTGPEVVFDEKENAFYIVFDVTEGRQYRTAEIAVQATMPSPNVKTSRFGLRTGHVYSPYRAQAAADRASLDASREGYEVAVVPKADRRANGTVGLEFQVDASAKAYVEKIDVVGNTRTADYVIRREFDLAEGDRFEPRLVRQAEKRLKALGFFSSVTTSTARGSAEDRVVLTVNVVEQDSGAFEIGGGFSSKDGPLAVASFSERNFMGTGRSFRASVGRGEDTGTYELSMTEPYLFGARVTGGFSLFRKDWSAEDNRFHPYGETETGGRFSLDLTVSADVLASVYYRLSVENVDDVDDKYTGKGTRDDPNLITRGDYVRSVLGGEWSFSNLDDETNPSDGTKITASQEWAGLGGDAAYVKTEVSAKAFKEVDAVRNIVAHLSVKGGSINGLGKDLSFKDQYSAGSDVVRGFARAGFGPRDAGTGLALGGQYYASASAEARLPAPLIPENFNLQTAFFADAGTVWRADPGRVAKSGATVVSDDPKVRAAIGTGIVWSSPVGQIRADFAYPVMKQDGDQTQFFSLSGGTRF